MSQAQATASEVAKWRSAAGRPTRPARCSAGASSPRHELREDRLRPRCGTALHLVRHPRTAARHVGVDDDTADFTASLGCLIEPALAGLAAQVPAVGGVTPRLKAFVLIEAVGESLRNTLHRKLARVLVLELNAARVTGRLTAADRAARWDEVHRAHHPPRLLGRARRALPPAARPGRPVIGQPVRGRDRAGRALRRRPRGHRPLSGDPRRAGRVAFGAGDCHRGGQTVAILAATAGRIVYKPRSVRRRGPQRACRELLAAAGPSAGSGCRGCWTGTLTAGPPFAHRLLRQRRGTAPLLPRHRALAGRHAPARRQRPARREPHRRRAGPDGVDCETLFTPHAPAPPTGLRPRRRPGRRPGRRHGAAAPASCPAAAWRWAGAASTLRGRRPARPAAAGELPVLVDAGTDRAHIGMHRAARAGAEPPEPDPCPRPTGTR